MNKICYIKDNFNFVWIYRTNPVCIWKKIIKCGECNVYLSILYYVLTWFRWEKNTGGILILRIHVIIYEISYWQKSKFCRVIQPEFEIPTNTEQFRLDFRQERVAQAKYEALLRVLDQLTNTRNLYK